MYEIDNLPGYIPIGNRRDFGHTIQLDLTAWADLNADDWVITYMRPGGLRECVGAGGVWVAIQ